MSESSPAPARPKNAVVLLLDSLNRHMLGSYGGTEFDTPNLDRIGARALRFDRHYSGSLPCMPARHDILTGSLDFLWRPWGSIELWERPLSSALREAGVTTQLVTDHPHLFETGGENYHCDFTAWDYQRGHESDPWKTRPDSSWAGCPSYGREWTHYDNSRGYFREEENFPGPRTLTSAARWLEENAGHHDRFMLFVDEFDPHEPFDTPQHWAELYDPDWEGAHLIWPPYVVGGVESGVLSQADARQLRASYGAKLSMIDAWVGRVLDTMDRLSLWDDTALLLCTDHGHYLGEKDIFGKPRSPIFEPLGHTPLLVCWPGVEAGRIDALSTNVDIFSTLIDLFGAEVPQRTHGQSLLPLIEGRSTRIRDYALMGIWGREVHLVDGRYKYARAPKAQNEPLSMWSNRWSTMPVARAPALRMPDPDSRARLDRMPGSDIPVIRQPFVEGDMLPYWGYGPFIGNQLHDLRNDPGELENRVGDALERDLAEKLRSALLEIEAPDDQLERLGLD